jgi:hypothetical protein
LGRKLLDEEVYQLGDTELVPADYLLYCFYGAKVCIAVRDLKLGMHLLELAITMPTGVGDAIMLESWLLYQMVGPLASGVASFCCFPAIVIEMS